MQSRKFAKGFVFPKGAFLSGAAALSALLLFSGCDKPDQITSYTTPKEPKRAPRLSAMSGGAPGQPHIHGAAPAHWQEQAPSGMRLAAYTVSGDEGQAEVTVIPLAGGAGSDLENVNRWRDQIGLEPVAADQLAALGEKAVVLGVAGALYDMAGKTPATGKATRTLAAVMTEAGTSFFVKMTGPDALVAREKAAFKEFNQASTIHFGSHDADAQSAAASTPPPGGADPAGPAWQTPDGWTQQAPGPMILSRFRAAAGSDVTVTMFPGDVGGLFANVNRWRGQIGLAPISESELTKLTSTLDVNGVTATVIDMANDKAERQPSRMVAVVLQHNGQSWFFKIMGEGRVVEADKAAFLNFVKSTRLPNA